MTNRPVGITNGTILDALSVNTLRLLAADAVQQARSGHPGTPMGAAPTAYVLWTRFLAHNPADPSWPDRDRFILSAGHASMLLYALLHLTGYDLPLDELRRFRQWGSRTPGHPEAGLTPGVETTTGPLGQGFANGIGMAIAERHLAAQFNRPGHTIVDHYTYSLVSDGDLQEGVSSEAASLAGTLRLGKIVYLYDDNGIQIEGSTDLAFTEQVDQRFEAYHWHVQRVRDGTDLHAIEAAIRAAREVTDRPSLVIVQTTIGYGSPHRAGTALAHGEPLGEEEVRATKAALDWPLEPAFYIPAEALTHFRQAVAEGLRRQQEWQDRLDAYAADYPEEAAEWQRRQRGELPPDWDADLPTFRPEDGPMATRVASGKALRGLSQRVRALIGGSADLGPSTHTQVQGQSDFSSDAYSGRNLHFGVREHAMGAISNGLARHGGLIPYAGTFLVFSDYMRPPIRLAALSRTHVIYLFSHDSIGLGEDGPTHQPIEQLAALRAIPELVVIRPADANETTEAWRVALQRPGPCALALSRQSLPIIDRSTRAPATELNRGAYVLAEAPGGKPEVLLLATGSEVALALAGQELLATRGVAARVVSMPSWELFDEQDAGYRDTVLLPSVRARVSVEAGVSLGWRRYVGDGGVIIGLDHFAASAPAAVLFEKFGFTPEHVAAEALRLLGRKE